MLCYHPMQLVSLSCHSKWQLKWLLLLFSTLFVRGSKNIPGRTLAVANFDCDQDVDLVQLVDESHIKIRCLKAGRDGECKGERSKWEFPVRTPGYVVGAAVSSFDGDLEADILITENSHESGLVSAYIQWGSKQGFADRTLLGNFTGQPTVFDCNHDGYMDVVGIRQDPLLTETNSANETWICLLGSGERLIAQNATVAFRMSASGRLEDYPVVYTSLSSTRIPQLYVPMKGQAPGSFGGFQGWIPAPGLFRKGHRIPDPFVQTVSGQRLFVPSERAPEDLVWGFPCVDDFNLDGNVDILVPALSKKDPGGLLLYIYENTTLYQKWYEVETPLTGDMAELIDISPNAKIRLRSADINHDGYPDLVVVLGTSSDANVKFPHFTGPAAAAGAPKPFLLMNEPCSPGEQSCTKPPGIRFTFGFLPLLDRIEVVGDVVEAAFIEVLSNSVNLGLLLVEEIANSTGGKSYISQTAQLVGSQTASFLIGECYVPGDCKFKSEICKQDPYGGSVVGTGVSFPGACFDYTSTDNNGTTRRGAGCLLPMMTHTPLGMPMFLAGLGETFNFVEQLRLTIPLPDPTSGLGEKGLSAAKDQVIPNSRIFVIPCPIDKPENWKWRNFVTPGRLVLLSFAAMAMICGVIILIIIGFHVHEKRQDQKERLAQTHKFHFNAL